MEIRDFVDTYVAMYNSIMKGDWIGLANAVLENPLYRAIIGVVAAIAIGMVLAIIAIYMLMKVLADFQTRYGQNRVGPYGSLQIIADMIKMITKEDVIPKKVDIYGFWLGPMMMLGIPLVALVAIPLTKDLIVTDLDIGILYIEAVASVAAIGGFIAGWAPRNKFSVMGALRGVASMISYEIPLGLSVIAVAIMAGSLSTVSIVEAQSGIWFIVPQFLGFLIFYTCFLAEAGQIPFDLRESEQELACGYSVEYSGMRFGLGFVGEFLHVVLGSMLVVVLFLGGWHGPVIINPMLSGAVWFFIKTIFMIWFAYMVRASLPRYRIDQLLKIGWKVLLPLALANLVYTTLLIYVLRPGV